MTTSYFVHHRPTQNPFCLALNGTAQVCNANSTFALTRFRLSHTLVPLLDSMSWIIGACIVFISLQFAIANLHSTRLFAHTGWVRYAHTAPYPKSAKKKSFCERSFLGICYNSSCKRLVGRK